MEPTIREATLDDVPVLARFLLEEAREAQDLTLDPERARAAVEAAVRDPDKARYWILDDGSGAISVTREWSDWNVAHYWWVSFVYVTPEARGRRVIDRLIEHVRRAAAQAGAPELRLYVHPENARAVRAYERLGFRALPYRIMSIAPAPLDPEKG